MADGGMVDSVIQSFKNLPAAQEAKTTEPLAAPSSNRLFGRQKSVHELLGGGRGADIILWRETRTSATLLTCVTIVYIVFEWLGCHVLSVLSKGTLIVFGALFVWSNVAALVKRSTLDFPRPQVSEETALQYAFLFKDQANFLISMLHEVILGKDIKLFLKVEFVLWILTYVGKWADFLTSVYFGVLLVLTIPVLYERHEEKVDRSLQQGLEETRKLHGKFQEQVSNRMSQLSPVQKKVE